MILNCIIWQCSPSVYYLFPISYRRLNTERSIVLPICTVSIAVRAMCKCCGTFLNVILTPFPCLFFRRVVIVSQSHCSSCLSLCLSVRPSVRLHGRIFVQWRLVFVHLQYGHLIHVALPAFRIWKMALRFLENLCTPLLSHTNINARYTTVKLNVHMAISTYNLYEFPAPG